jgi:hypothetical protein
MCPTKGRLVSALGGLARPNSRPRIVGRVHSSPRVAVIRKGRAGHSTVIQQPVVRLVAKQTSQRSNGDAVGSDDEASSPRLALYHGFVQALLHVCGRTTAVVPQSPNFSGWQSCISLGGTVSEVLARLVLSTVSMLFRGVYFTCLLHPGTPEFSCSTGR